MRLRDRAALNLTPLFLRLALGITFLWAGSAKLFYSHPFTGSAAERLASLNIVPGAAVPKDPAPPADKGEPEAPAPAPAPDSVASPTDAPPPSADEPPTAEAAAAPIQADSPEPESSTREVRAPRLYLLTLMLDRASTPDAGGRVAWPQAFATPSALRLTPWMVAVVELLGGFLVLVGFMTRFWALALAGTMAVALWLTQIFPSIGAPGSLLGFLPAPMLDDPANWSSAWEKMLFQFILLMAALGLVFSGAGRASIDSVIFKPAHRAAPAKPSA